MLKSLSEVENVFVEGVSVWRSAVHSVLLPPPSDRISTSEAAVRVFFGGINFGILCFPFAFRMAGMVNGVVFVIAIALLNNYACKMILNARNKLAQEETGRPINTLPDLAYAAFGSMGSSTVGYLMFACHFGFAVTHCIFIGISMAALLKEADGYSWFHNHGHYEVYVAFVCLWGVGFCTLVQVADTVSIIPYQRAAVVAMILSVLVTIVHGLMYPSVCDDDFLIRTLCRVHIARWETLPVFFGIAIFVLESVPVLLAIETSMEHPDELSAALDTGQTGQTVLYMLVGVMGYWIYGANTESVIALNVSGVPGAVVKLLQCFAMTVAYVGLFLPACRFLEELLDGELVHAFYQPLGPVVETLGSLAPKPAKTLAISPFKMAMVVATVGLALAFPHFGHMTSLFGCLVFAVLNLAVPPIIYVKVFQTSISRGKLVRCALVLLAAVLVAVLGLISNFMTVHVHRIDSAPPSPPSRPAWLHQLSPNSRHALARQVAKHLASIASLRPLTANASLTSAPLHAHFVPLSHASPPRLTK